MKMLPAFLSGLVLAAVSCANQEAEPEPAAVPEMSEEAAMALMMQQMELAAPGPEHKELANAVGEWNMTMKWRMSPEEPWQESAGSSKIQSTLGGRVLVEKYSAPMPEFGSMEGLLMLGYDNMKEEYWAIHMSNFATWPSYTSGQMDENGVTNMTGIMVDTVTPDGRAYRVETHKIDDDHTIVKGFDTIPPHGEIQVFEMDYTRKQP